jgi:L-lactate dehydrogenase (cytochrome)/(S)-mandelate dehydrogenase
VRLDKALNVEDMRRLAKRRLPRIIFDFIDGAAEDETAARRNLTAFARYEMRPRALAGVANRDPSVELFGHRYAQPFGIAPTGAAGLFHVDGDIHLVQAAAAANIPFVLSGSSHASIERAAAAAPGHAWYQLYLARDLSVSYGMVERAQKAGMSALVLTVDVPHHSRRERNLRHGFSFRKRLPPAVMAEAILHPAWVLAYFRSGGLPILENWAHHAPPGSDAAAVGAFFDAQTPLHAQGWEHFAELRRRWKGPLIVKGILHPGDAVKAEAMGADGIVVSNHGGRQFDRTPVPVDIVPEIRGAVSPAMRVMLDSGIRRGADMLIALSRGAEFVFIGRPAAYGLAAGGRAGVDHVIALLAAEIDKNLGLLGMPDIAALGADPARLAPY